MACRICTANDRNALIEALAAEMWNSHRDREVFDVWEKAPSYWQNAYRGHAEGLLRVAHGEARKPT